MRIDSNNLRPYYKYIVIGLFVFVLTSFLAYLNLGYYVNSPGGNDQAVRIIINRGYSVKKIGKELTKNDLVIHPKLFWLIHKIFFAQTSLQAGEYEIPIHASIRDIINMMHRGEVIIHKLTLPEGITVKEIITKIQLEPMLLGEVTNEFAEGDFLANTYFYTYGETKMMLLNRMYKESQTIIDELWNKRSPNLPLSSKKDAMTLASIIEKETSIGSERARISAVFINRLRKNMKLQADPTVIYAVTRGQYVLNRSITLNDLKIKSLYNTYLYSGLPPTPIATPGKAALEAALNPLNTNELYFVVDNKGGHNFSTNLNDHNIHVQNYRKGIKDDVK